MSSLNVEQYASQSEYPVVDGGDYELYVKLTKRFTKDGSKEYISCDFLIRDDEEATKHNSLNAKWKGAHVFDKCFRDKSNPEWFDLKKLGTILVTQKGKPNYKVTFNDCDLCIQYLNGISLVAHVDKKYDDYQDKEVNEIKYLSYKATTLPDYVEKTEVAPAPAPAPTPVSERVDVPDSDLPF